MGQAKEKKGGELFKMFDRTKLLILAIKCNRKSRLVSIN